MALKTCKNQSKFNAFKSLFFFIKLQNVISVNKYLRDKHLRGQNLPKCTPQQLIIKRLKLRQDVFLLLRSVAMWSIKYTSWHCLKFQTS